MNDSVIRRMRLFGGPNGSGKSSLVRSLAREFTQSGLFSLHHYINADDIYRDLCGGGFDLAAFGVDVSWSQLREAIVAAGRLPASHPFL